MTIKKSLITIIIDSLLILIAAVIVLVAVLFSTIRLLLPYAPQYQNRIETWASLALKKPVQVASVTVGWRGLEPEFRFSQVVIFNDDRKMVLLNVRQLDISIAVIDSLLKWRVEPGRVIISGVNVKVQQRADGEFVLNDLLLAHDQSFAVLSWRDYAKWLLNQGNIYLQNVNFTWVDAAGKTFVFSNVKLKIMSSLLNYQISGAAILHQPEPAAFNFLLNCSHDVLSNKDFTAKIYLHANKLQLSPWLTHRFADVSIASGQANFSLWVTWSQQQLQSLQTLVTATKVAVQSRFLQQNLFFKQVAGGVNWQRDSAGWHLTGNQLQFNLDNKVLTPLSFSLQVVPAQASQPAQQTLQINNLDVADAEYLLLSTTLLTPPQRDLVQKLNPSGTVKNLIFTHEGVERKLRQFELKTDFSGLSWLRYNKIPGAVNLNGQLDIQPTQGSLSLNTKNALFDFGDLFRVWLPVNQLDADVTWQKQQTTWHIKVANLIAHNDVVSVNGDLHLLLPQNFRHPFMNLLAGFNVSEPVAALQYLPIKIMSPKLINWLQHAILAGKEGSGSLLLRGPLDKFPFVKQQGRFSISSHLQDVTLNYKDSWPVIQHLDADLDFDNNAMSVRASDGEILKTNFQDAEANIPDLHHPILSITGKVNTDLQQALQFLWQSPLNNTIGKQLRPLHLTGPMNLDLQLIDPLKKPGMDVNGHIAMQNADLLIPQWWNLHVENLQGNLQFTENSLTGDVQGDWFNTPVQVKIATLQRGTNQSVIQFDLGRGQITLQQLQQRFQVPASPYIQGAFNYSALLQLPNKNNNKPGRLIVNSNLQGISVNLPAPLGKSVNAAIASQVQLLFTNKDEPPQLLVSYGKNVSAALNFAKDKQRNLYLSGGEISFGGKQAVLQSQPGLLIDGSLPSFSWADWKPILGNLIQPGVTKATTLLRKIDLNFAQLNVLNFPLTQTNLQIMPQVQAWQVKINNKNMDGTLLIPKSYPRGTLNGRFTRLYLSSNAQQQSKLNPEQIPGLDFICQDFRYNNKQFGNIALKTSPEKNGLEIDQLNARSAAFNLSVTGQWQGSDNSQHTQLRGSLTTSALGTALNNWAITKNLVGGKGATHFQLSWAGSPYQPKMQNIAGTVNFNFNDGRIINLSSTAEAELGLGRILNLFSLQSIPRRLRLDFSDLTDSGFSFDVMRGDFTLKNGNAVTKNAFLNGPVAKVSMQGRIGMAQHDYDLNLLVTPYVTSSIPVIATIAGGPLIGAIAWVANKILSPLFNQVATYQYHVTGSWGNPTILKLLVPPPQKNAQATPAAQTALATHPST